MRHAHTIAPIAPAVIRNPSERSALKTLTRELVTRLGGLDAAAACTRVQRSNLAEYGSLHHPERFAPIDVILDLEVALGAPLVTGALARASGCRVVGEATVSVGGDVNAALSRVGREASALFAAVMDALADGQLDPSERRALVREVDDLIAAAEAARRAMADPAEGTLR